jgi:hypothetical protein
MGDCAPSSVPNADVAVVSQQGSSTLLTIDSGRPVMRGALALQAKYGYVITYEDPPYTNKDDLVDAAATVRKDYATFPPGTAPPLLTPKPAELVLTLPKSATPSSEEMSSLLQQLVRAQAASSRGGRFRIVQAGDIFHIEPVGVRDRDGNWSTRDSLLSAPISLPEEDRTEFQLYRAIANAVGAQAQVSVKLVLNGGIVMGHQAPAVHSSMGANNEPARAVLERVLALHGSKRTWALLHTPEIGPDSYILNILDIPRTRDITFGSGRTDASPDR